MNKFLVLSLLVFLTACGSNAKQGAYPVSVEAITVQTQPWHASVQTTATVMAESGTILKSEVIGRVTNVAFKPGSAVIKGQLLFAINPAQLAAKLKMAQAMAELEQANYRRAFSLYRQHVISKADFDRAKATAVNDSATVEAAQAALDDALVHAPFAGVVGLNLVQEGDYVTIGQALVSLQQLDRLRLDFTVAEQYSDQVKLGDQVLIRVRDLHHHQYLAVVSALDNAIDVNTRLMAVRATFVNPELNLLPGAYVDVTLSYGPEQHVLTTPQIAVVSSADGDSVFRIVKGKAVATSVTLGARFADQVIIVKGLMAGDQVITAGQLKLHDGALVRVTHG